MFKPREIEVGKKRVTSEEFVTVANSTNVVVTINTASLAALKDQSGKRFPEFNLQKYRADASNDEKLTQSETRGVIFMLLLALLQEKAHVRPEIVQAFAEMLNANVLPVLPSFTNGDAAIMSALLDSITSGTSNYIGDKLEHVPPTPNNNEARRILQLPVASQSAVIVAAQVLFQMLPLFDLSVALGLELTGLSLEPFQIIHHDQAHPHQEAINTCNVIRNVLLNSQCAGKYVDVVAKNKKNDEIKQLYVVPPSFATVPDLHGVSKQVITQLYQTSRKEIVSCNAVSAADDVFDGQQSLDYILAGSKATNHIIASLSKAICERVQYILSNAQHFGAQIVGAPNDDPLALYERIQGIAESIPSDSSIAGSSRVADVVAFLNTASRQLRELLINEITIYIHILQNKTVDAAVAQEQAAKAKQETLLKKVQEFRDKGKDDLADKLLASQNKPGGKDKKASGGITLGNGTSELFRTLVPVDKTNEKVAYDVLLQHISNIITKHDQHFATLIGNVVNASVSTEVKMPKGTRDITPDLMVIRERCFNTITTIFKQHGGCEIDTPVFELRDTLTGKYGEDSKLIYDLADQGGELLSLRYDLTVPFARFCATHGVASIKRYHIGKVYRRDQPVMTRGRFREFYQCDFDIAGECSPMVNDSEVIVIMVRILRGLSLGSFMVKLNHRALLDSIMTVCGVPHDKLRPVCSAIDKLDKLPWDLVKQEMCVDKGLDPSIADQLEQFVTLPAGNIPVVLEQLKANETLSASADAQRAFSELATLHTYLSAADVLDNVTLDMSLARGLDYYTGVIYEAVLTGVDEDGKQLSFGSIAAGGRYDKLVGMFSGRDVPAVGVSIGIERVLAMLEQRERALAQQKNKKLKINNTAVLVASNPVGNDGKYNLLLERMRVTNELRVNHNINTEYVPNDDPKIRKQAIYAETHQIPIIVWLGVDELDRGIVSVKLLTETAEDSIKPVEVTRAEMGDYIKKLLNESQQ